MTDSLSGARQFWDELAERDPLWAILSDPSKRGGRWDLASFFATGEREISTLLHQLKGLPGGRPTSQRAALDFGCGVGRLTQALAGHFQSVVGVDVSSVMLDHARRLNRYDDRVRYVHNQHDNLNILREERFDLVYTDLVLQHLPPRTAMRYVGELLRLVTDRGFLVFQLPSHRRETTAATVTPMADSAYRAKLEPARLPSRWQPGATATLLVRVTNAGEYRWDQRAVGPIRLGNHWLGPGKAMLIQDDGRSPLPELIVPGQSALIELDVNVPREEGVGFLELDLVHEGLSWFADRGSVPSLVEVATTRPVIQSSEEGSEKRSRRDESLLRPYISAQAGDEVAFPMYGVPRGEVEGFLRANGGTLVLTEADDRGGVEWEGYRYFVRR